MQIHYLWVNKSNYLNNASISLSARFIFEMTEEVVDKSDGRKLTIKNNPDFIPRFFGKDNVTNVSAIIGKNGAGKSSILKYIRRYLPIGARGSFFRDIIAFSIDALDQSLYIAFPETLNIQIEDQTGRFSEEPYGDSIESSYIFPIGNTYFGIINYSYLLEYNDELTDWSGLRNISTAALLNATRNQIIEENPSSPDTILELFRNTSDAENLYLNEVARAIQFLISNFPKENKLPFNKPEELIAEINLDDVLYFRNEPSERDIKRFIDELIGKNTSKPPHEKFIQSLMLAIFVNVIVEERKHRGSFDMSSGLLSINEDESIKDFVLRFFSELKDRRVNMEDGSRVEMAKHQLLAREVPVFIKFIEEELMAGGFSVKEGFEGQLIVPLNDEATENFEKLSSFYLRIKGLNTFLKFRWRSLSTGEQSYLSLMARFYHEKHHAPNDLPTNLLILIDEGDACYHPEWQRRFFNETLNYLSRLFEDHSIQLIFTANTPFLSSDLPKSHVLFINKRKDHTSEFNSKENGRIDTFGANIHTLFSDAFYMDGVLMGDFAKKRINEIIAYLKDKEIKIPQPDYKKTISMIGEPVLRRKLQDMWSEKFGTIEEKDILLARLREIEEEEKRNANKSDEQ